MREGKVKINQSRRVEIHEKAVSIYEYLHAIKTINTRNFDRILTTRNTRNYTNDRYGTDGRGTEATGRRAEKRGQGRGGWAEGHGRR